MRKAASSRREGIVAEQKRLESLLLSEGGAEGVPAEGVLVLADVGETLVQLRNMVDRLAESEHSADVGSQKRQTHLETKGRKLEGLHAKFKKEKELAEANVAQVTKECGNEWGRLSNSFGVLLQRVTQTKHGHAFLRTVRGRRRKIFRGPQSPRKCCATGTKF